MRLNKKVNNLITKLNDSSRFFKLETDEKTWFYDAYSHSLLSLDKQIFSDLGNTDFFEIISKLSLDENVKVFNFFAMINKYSEDKMPKSFLDDKCTVMINTSNHCNLNCSYCYRNKESGNKINLQKIDEIFEFIQNKYKPNASEYIISYSMTSESSLDLPLLKDIAGKYTQYEDYQFKESDFYDDKLDSLFERLINDFSEKIMYPQKPTKDKKSIILFLNHLLYNYDLFELLQLSYSMFPQDKLGDVQNRKTLSKWRQVRVNRWCLEIVYDRWIKTRNIPHVCFWFMTNGTCASKEFIDFIKISTIDPLWISIDGPKEVHDANRKFMDNKPSYDQIVRNIAIFQNNNIKLRASVVITSAFPKPLEIINHLLKLGFSSFSMTPVRPGSKNSFTIENISELLLGYDLLYEEIKKQCLHNNFTMFSVLKEDMTLAAFNYFTSRIKQIKRCDFGNQLVIDAKGEIYPCLYFVDDAEFSYGNIKDGYKAKYQDEEMLVHNRGNCRTCWARYLCGGTCFYGSKVATGDCLDIEPVECILKKHLAERCLDLLVFMREHNIDIYKLY